MLLLLCFWCSYFLDRVHGSFSWLLWINNKSFNCINFIQLQRYYPYTVFFPLLSHFDAFIRIYIYFAEMLLTKTDQLNLIISHKHLTNFVTPNFFLKFNEVYYTLIFSGNFYSNLRFKIFMLFFNNFSTRSPLVFTIVILLV